MSIYKGIYFETARNRWRVRLYRGNLICHLSYHDTQEDAERAYEDAKKVQAVPAPPASFHHKLSVHSALEALY